MNIKKFLPLIIFIVFAVLVSSYFGIKALTKTWPLPRPILNPAPTSQKVNLDVSAWETYQSERFGISFKYPKEWKLRQRYKNTYPELIAPNDKCVIHTAVEPTDPGQTVEQWFIEKWDAGGFHADILDYEFITAAGKEGILAKFAEATFIMGELHPDYGYGFEKRPKTTKVGTIQLYLPVPKEDYVFVLGLGKAFEEKELLPECKTIFDLISETLVLKARKIPR